MAGSIGLSNIFHQPESDSRRPVFHGERGHVASLRAARRRLFSKGASAPEREARSSHDPEPERCQSERADLRH